MQFKITNKLLPNIPAIFCTELNAPTWLTSTNTVKGSTMDNRWFWKNHVLTLDVRHSVETDFNIITRIG